MLATQMVTHRACPLPFDTPCRYRLHAAMESIDEKGVVAKGCESVQLLMALTVVCCAYRRPNPGNWAVWALQDI